MKRLSEQGMNRISYFSDEAINGIALPERFTFPFYYEPHPLTRIAAAELQHYLETLTDLDHNFGLSPDKEGLVIGKMFGVLVVADAQGRLGYLSAFSGKLADSNDHPRFVPPVFDMLVENSFFLKEQEVISAVNTRLEALCQDEDYLRLKQELAELSAQAAAAIAALKQQQKQNKEARRRQREIPRDTEEEYARVEAELAKQSIQDHFLLKDLKKHWEQQLEEKEARLASYEANIEALKTERKERSGALQQQLFDQYVFLNKAGKTKSLHEIFSATVFGQPPSAAGECAAPKLLQYAFANSYNPLAFGEFWWGASPKSEIRKHKLFYPACAGKCKPILAHMLEGMPLEENPFLHGSEQNGPLDIVYEDNALVVINKPEGLRSVPGVNIADSVYTRLKHLLNAEPYMVHRLDMDTSGLLVVAKSQQIHRHLQMQFLKRMVSKRYRALLSKSIAEQEGIIDLPLCPDPFNRPRQLVCFTNGKKSITEWKVVSRDEATTKVDFWPLTGRTHQLRMHAAHELGLNAPIVGDDLYGTAAERMYLHAAYIEFTHPQTKENMSFEVPESF